jgi:hypothetical protein
MNPGLILARKVLLCVTVAVLLNACGSSGDTITLLPQTMSMVEDADSVPLDAQQTEMFQQSTAQVIGDADAPVPDNLTGVLVPAIFASDTGIDPAFAQSSAALVQQLNESLLLPTDINVVFADCGVANAFFIPTGFSGDPNVAGDIVMCHELTAVFANFFGNNDQAFLASTFVLMHELGHALVQALSLPVLGIEESYVDGIAAVLLGESGLSQGSVLAGWFFGGQPNTPFFDTHRAGPQRLGDLACWGVGADMSLLSDPIIDSLAAQLIQGGRNCALEYQQQLDGFSDVLGPSIRGGFDILDVAQLTVQ